MEGHLQPLFEQETSGDFYASYATSLAKTIEALLTIDKEKMRAAVDTILESTQLVNKLRHKQSWLFKTDHDSLSEGKR